MRRCRAEFSLLSVVVTVLAALLGAVPAALLTAAPAAAETGSPPAVTDHVLQLDASAAPTGAIRQVDTAFASEMVAFEWDGTVSGEIVVRGLTAGAWSDWMTIDGEPGEGPDTTSREFHATTSAGPVWVGQGVTEVQFRVTQGQLPNLRLHAIRSQATAADSARASAGLTPQATLAPAATPAIISRAQWGADESWRTYVPGCDGSVGYADNVHYLIVHHTVDSNTYLPSDSAALVRGIYYFHTHTRMWCDIGYNFLVDQYGQIFEGRYGGITSAVIGAHAGGFNTGSAGIALIGTFDSVSPPPAMYASLRRLAAWKAAVHGINPAGTVTIVAGSFPAARWPEGTNVTLPTIIGHRDVETTDCPGTLASSLLAQLRSNVAADVGTAWQRSWSGWSAEPPSPDVGLTAAPAVASWGDDHFDQFVKGSDQHLWHRFSEDGSSTFSPWEDLGSPPTGLASSPAAVSWGYGRLDVFVRGGDNALWHLWYDGGQWAGWESLGGVLSSAPAVSSWSIGRLDVFMAGSDHAIWHKWYAAGWSGFESRGGYGVFDPAVTSWGPGRIDLFTVGSTGALYHSWWDGRLWHQWSNEVAGAWASGPGAASWGPGRVDVFLAGGGSTRPMIHAWYSGGWYSESLGGTLTAAPAAVSWRYNRLDTFVAGTTGLLYHDTYPGLS